MNGGGKQVPSLESPSKPNQNRINEDFKNQSENRRSRISYNDILKKTLSQSQIASELSEFRNMQESQRENQENSKRDITHNENKNTAIRSSLKSSVASKSEQFETFSHFYKKKNDFSQMHEDVIEHSEMKQLEQNEVHSEHQSDQNYENQIESNIQAPGNKSIFGPSEIEQMIVDLKTTYQQNIQFNDHNNDQTQDQQQPTLANESYFSGNSSAMLDNLDSENLNMSGQFSLSSFAAQSDGTLPTSDRHLQRFKDQLIQLDSEYNSQKSNLNQISFSNSKHQSFSKYMPSSSNMTQHGLTPEDIYYHNSNRTQQIIGNTPKSQRISGRSNTPSDEPSFSQDFQMLQNKYEISELTMSNQQSQLKLPTPQSSDPRARPRAHLFPPPKSHQSQAKSIAQNLFEIKPQTINYQSQFAPLPPSPSQNQQIFSSQKDNVNQNRFENKEEEIGALSLGKGNFSSGVSKSIQSNDFLKNDNEGDSKVRDRPKVWKTQFFKGESGKGLQGLEKSPVVRNSGSVSGPLKTPSLVSFDMNSFVQSSREKYDRVSNQNKDQMSFSEDFETDFKSDFDFVENSIPK